ncbi:MAG TPA: hypothetical protein VHX61_04825 [Rhizomicrobium sp.]|jgi:hypothetical protein|nr:hypothetical protein [Rhizomicrobium sp.]
MAAIVAAALFGGGSLARAMTEAPASGWIYQPFAAPDARDGRRFISAPDLPFLMGSSGAPLAAPYAPPDAPFAGSGSSPAGLLSISGVTTAITVPHLLSGGLIDRDGPIYTVRDLELVDRLTGNVAIDLGYDFDLGRRFDPTDVRANPAYAGLFLSPSDWNLSGFGESGFYAGTSLGLGGGVSLNLGGSESGADRTSLLPQLLPYPGAATAGVGFDQREAETALAGVDWKFAPWGAVGLTAARNAAQTGFLGGSASVAGLEKSQTNALGASGRIAFGSGWITSFTYNQGVTQLDLRPVGNLAAAQSLQSRSYGLAIAKHGLFGDDALGIAVSRPVDLGVNGVSLAGAATADPFDGFIAANTRPILGGATTPETDLGMGYVTTFLDGALALQANAGYQMNAEGQSGNNGVTVLSRAKINF